MTKLDGYSVFWVQIDTYSRQFDTILPFVELFDSNSMTKALIFMEELRKRDNVQFVTMACQNSNSVGKPGVDTVADGKTPDGVPYTWVKRRPPDTPKFTTGHCVNLAQPGGCKLHNLQCGYPECDRKPA